MLLTSLEIKGFKSFANKTHIEFIPGVTAIVGPNGCGKSNVIDAMRWVLGEQKSRMLRSDKMENVLFNGTKLRSPAGMAEVTIAFGDVKQSLNTDFDTLAITRRLFRTGESEYQINGVGCRLKDIHNLLYNTGIGADAYSIMELRMIEEILNDREGSRRALFEDAAGIAKYKQRKKETQASLNDTLANLERVEDLLDEIQKNIRSLSVQAKKAEAFKALQQEYRDTAVRYAVHATQAKAQKLLALEAHAEELRAERTMLHTQLEQQEATLAEARFALAAAEAHMDDANQTNTAAKLAAAEAEHRHQTARQHVGNAQREWERATQEARLQNETASRITMELGYITKELGAQEVALEAAKKQRSTDGTALDGVQDEVAQLAQAYGAATALRNDLASRVAQADKQLALQEAQKEQLARQAQRLAADLAARRQQHGQAKAKQVELLAERSGITERLSGLRQAQKALQADENLLKLQTTHTRTTLSEANRALDTLRTEHRLAKSLAESLEGYSDAVQLLKKNTAWALQTHVLADSIDAQPDYKAAVEVALGDALNGFLVDSTVEAQRGMSALSAAQKGKALFLWANVERVHAPPPLPVEGFVHALAVVAIKAEHAGLISELLALVWFYDQDSMPLPQVLEARKRLPAGAVLVSQNGAFRVDKFGVLGGSVNLFEGRRLGRQQNLDALTARLQTAEAAVQQAKTTLTAQADAQAHLTEQLRKLDIEQADRELRKLDFDLNTSTASLQNHAQAIEQLQHREAELAREGTPTADAPNVDVAQLQALRTQHQKAQTEAASLDTSLQAARGHLQQKQAAANQLALNVQRLEGEVRQKERDVLRLQTQLEDNAQRAHQSSETIGRLQMALVEAEQEASLATQFAHTAQNTAADALLAFTNTQAALQNARGQNTTLEQSLTAFRSRREVNANLLENTAQTINELRLATAATTERLAVEFELEWVDALAEFGEESPLHGSSLNNLEKHVQSLRGRINTYGPVNPLAMESFTEATERSTFIIAQRDDLLDARKTLEDTIAELDAEATERFITAFTSIRENFIKVFRTLFTEEDNCDLLLAQPDKPLESAINIVAMPKGKRPLTINQLSGGEKTLTAIALLFSIYLLRPAPFCVFDEVDAPLDDANIDKFNNIIRQFSAQSQFVVVTHNKRTMETTDVLYGVTMAEQGVSTLVPVDLRTFATN